MKKGAGNDGENDRELWNHVTRGIKAYHPSGRQLPAAKSSLRTVIQHIKSKPPALPLVPAPQGKGFDRATETRLRRGELPLEGRLDLHGLTQAEAFAALHRFIASAVAQEKRTVLVITGKASVLKGFCVARYRNGWKIRRWLLTFLPLRRPI